MNLAARSLSDVRSKTVGVLVADLRNPLLVDIVERAGQVFEDEGFSTLLISAIIPSRPTSGPRIDGCAIGTLKDLRVEAMLVVGSVPAARPSRGSEDSRLWSLPRVPRSRGPT
jgi:DNA-binding LacI/PurR family transcriptional regulator